MVVVGDKGGFGDGSGGVVDVAQSFRRSSIVRAYDRFASNHSPSHKYFVAEYLDPEYRQRSATRRQVGIA
ncbi:hypothetical protein ASD12_28125 [Mesorhizobium sp. Root102]|uniref:hypothetical protein n=1 Tax=Mesorhizobium sp. Root102 TaxID=1736422 RepID=UPI000714DAB8|nr:hypothetical protein [Mesorhizobium sp. Root102]KQU89584.1 hypothetical protein ASD12_28125 [Mesorhizobium sp. Root102]